MRNKTDTQPPTNDARLDRLVDELAENKAEGETLSDKLKDAYKIVFVHNSSESVRLLEEFDRSKKYARALKHFEDCVRSALEDHGFNKVDHKALARNLISKLEQAGLTLQTSDRATPALPAEAPETYQGLRGPETPPEFVKRVYGPWLGQGLTRADIRKLDPKLSVAITNWLSRPGNEWPADVDLPTKAEQNERLLSAGPEAIREHLGKFTGQEALREAARINAAAHYRK